MREAKMAELKFEAPLAKFDAEEWIDFNEFQSSEDFQNSNKLHQESVKQTSQVSARDSTENLLVDNFSEFSGSLEDLVNCFDEKITKCFKNYEEKTDKIAPVQVRTQEEIMSDCQMWWTITGNYGNILPIDWSKTYARQLHMPALNLSERKENVNDNLDLSDDEDLAQAFDMHSLIVSSVPQEPVVSAEDVIEEIDELLQDSPTSELSSPFDRPQSGRFLAKNRAELEHKLEESSMRELTHIYEEMEGSIRENSETLVRELALRDELEYEKELKNHFISLLLSIQNKRRQLQMEKKNKKKKEKSGEGRSYLTTVIPYNSGMGPPSIQALQILIKILQAINEDSPTVAPLLTDYILKVLCPSSGS